MPPELFEELFGKSSAKVYLYTGTLLDNENPCESITVKFATAINNYLIDCLVTQISGNWYVYTKTPHELTGNDFQLMVSLPLPLPVVNENTGEAE
jgi:hypothetical protein